MTASAILDSVLDPFANCVTPEAARQIIEFRPDAETQDRVDELAALANSGKLTVEQETEYRELIDAFDLVAILKSKARAALGP